VSLALNKKEKKVNYPLLSLFSFSGLLIVYFFPYLISQRSQYMTRALVAFIPLIFTFFIYLLEKKSLLTSLNRYNKLIVLIMIIQFSASMLTTSHWMTFTKEFDHELATHKGVFSLDPNVFSNFRKEGRYYISHFQIWSFPIYSVFLSRDKDINSVAYFWENHFMTDRQLDFIKYDNHLYKYGFTFSYDK